MTYTTKITGFFNRQVAPSTLLVSSVSFAVFIFLISLFPPFYSVNDDAFRQMLVSGAGIASTPDAHLAYSNFILGYVLKGFYTFFPNLNWYGVFLTLCNALAYITVLNVVLKTKRNMLSVLFVFILTTNILLMYLSLFNYTSTAFFLGLAAGSLLLSDSFYGKNNWKSAFCFLFLCYLIRKEVFYLVLIITIPLSLLFSFLQEKNLAKIKAYSFKLITFLAIIFLLNIADTKINSDLPGNRWNGVHTVLVEWYNYGKVQFNKETEGAFRSVGWKEVDYKILMSPFLLWNVFDLESLKKVEAAAFTGARIDVLRGLRLLASALGEKGTIVVLFWSFLAFLIFGSLSRKTFLRVSISFFWLLFVLLVVGARLKMVAYVFLPVFTFLVLVCLLLKKEEKNFPGSWVQASAFLLLLLATSWGIKAHAGINRSRISVEKEYLDSLERLNPSPKNLYVVWGADLPAHFPRVLSGNIYPQMKMISTGWPLYTKATEDRLQEFQIENLYTAIYEKENVYLIADKSREQEYQAFIESHYGAKVHFEVQFESISFNVFKVRK